MTKNKTPAATGAREGGAGEMHPLSQQTPEKSTISWDDLKRIERATLPLLLMIGGDDDDRPDVPPQAMARVLLSHLFRELRNLAARTGRGHHAQ